MATAHDHKDDTPAVAALKRRKADDPRALLTRKQCETEGNWGQTSQIVKEASGALHRFLDGAVVKITAESFYDHLIDLASAPPRKARQPRTRFKPQRRAPTERQLEGLKVGMSAAIRKLKNDDGRLSPAARVRRVRSWPPDE